MQVLMIAAVMAVACAAPSNTYHQPAYHQPAYHQPAYHQSDDRDIPYRFGYAVNDHYSGAVFSLDEASDTKTTHGSYSVALPDGRTQHVTYVADQAGYGGFNADVTYTGVAHYDARQPSYHPAPAYRPSYHPAPAYEPSYHPAPAYEPSYHPAPVYGSAPAHLARY